MHYRRKKSDAVDCSEQIRRAKEGRERGGSRCVAEEAEAKTSRETSDECNRGEQGCSVHHRAVGRDGLVNGRRGLSCRERRKNRVGGIE